jgi:hypothetical protein
MPLFSNPQNLGPQAWEPEAAEGRLTKTAGASAAGVFTSDLSVSEYVLLGEAGFEPLGFVVGSSIYHLGLHPRPGQLARRPCSAAAAALCGPRRTRLARKAMPASSRACRYPRSRSAEEVKPRPAGGLVNAMSPTNPIRRWPRPIR